MVDDYANTNCNSLNNWANNNNINPASVFSNAAIKMSDYGSPGMPKVVVVGDVNHAVFYNANNSVNATALQEAINTAITSTTTGVAEDKAAFSSVEFFPNPSSTSSSIVFSLDKYIGCNELKSMISLERKFLKCPLPAFLREKIKLI